MPQTVPNRPTKGDVDPTVARNARPDCELACTRSTAAVMLIGIQSAIGMWLFKPPWSLVAAAPASAMKRYALFFSSALAAAPTLGWPQNFWSTVRAWRFILDCSRNLVIRRYQLPADMTARISSTARATLSEVFQSDSMP